MRSEREREAREARAQGFERGQQIRAGADRERTVLLAEARKQAEITRGEGEREANRIWAEAFGRDPGFFQFYRSMQAYREALGNEDTTMVLSPDSEFFRYFGSMAGRTPGTPRN
jgi:membrane protease subunit HflC